MTILTVEGMNCGHCEQTVEDAVRDVSGVERADAAHDAERVTVEGTASRESLVAAIEEAGYAVQALSHDSRQE